MLYAVVTGATRGIGKEIAGILLEQGFSVLITGRDNELLGSLKTQWTTQYPNQQVLTFQADIADKKELAFLGNYINEYLPQIDILVNNAGVFKPGEICEEVEGQLEHMIGVNLYSAYHLTRMLVPRMKANGSGHIFNMCSVASLKAYPHGGSYSISKYALLGFSDNLREELKNTGIKVTSICPGATYTSSWDGSGVAPERIMEARDIAKVLWGSYSLSDSANVDTIVIRPVKGDL